MCPPEGSRQEFSKKPYNSAAEPEDDMEQLGPKESAEGRRRYFILSVIITIIAIYAAVPTYGIIRDINTGQHVFILSSNLPGAQMNRPVLGFINRIYGLFSPQQKIPVPVGRRIDLVGRVVYTDYTPYSGGIIELRSYPRYTRTDSEGYFMFIDVEEGVHTVSVLDGAGNVLAECEVDIQWMPADGDLVLVRLADGTYVFQVPVQVNTLVITVFLHRGADGKVTSIDRIVLGSVTGSTIRPGSPTYPAHPAYPANPVNPGNPAYPGAPPVDPCTPPENGGGEGGGPGKGGGGSGNGSNNPPPFNFDVLDTATRTSYGTGSTAKVNIFGSSKRIAPGMSGTYQFTVDNTGNRYPSLYDLEFIARDTLPDPLEIPMRFRLKADGVYVAGNETTWCALSELYQDDAVVAGGRDVEYTLEWHWQEGPNDNDFAAYAGNPDYSYTLMIKVTAQAM
ncbi:MAG: hypothetical protein GXY90_05475 [Peptococcaceae bacterium]|nr:hypothetical protein [Peptococcaceae bacterium]